MTRHVQRQRAPAAPGFDDPLAAIQADLAADVIHFRDLRLVERRRRRRKVSTGVRHRLAEPQRVELVADVVVVVNVLARARERVARTAMTPLREAAPERDRLRGLRCADVQLLDHAQDAAVHVDFAGAVQLAELQVRIGAQAQERTAVRDAQRRDRRRAERRDPVAVPEYESDGRIAERVQQRANQPRFHRVTRVVGHHLRWLVSWPRGSRRLWAEPAPDALHSPSARKVLPFSPKS